MTETKLKILLLLAIAWFCLRLIFMRLRRPHEVDEHAEHGGV